MSQGIDFEGRNFISAKDAAKLVGYVPDYVGQLARGGKLEAKMVGRAWFVSRESILKHREMNLSASGASRVADFLYGAPKAAQAKNVSVPFSVSERNGSFESELSYGREDFSLMPSLGKKIISPIVGSNRPLVPFLSKATALITPELMQKVAALAVSSAFVFGAYAATERGFIANAGAFAASAARAVASISVNDARAVISDFTKNIPSYAAAGAEEFASSAAAVSDIPDTARGFAREIAKAFFRGTNFLARDARHSILSFLGAPVPGTGLAVSPPPAIPVEPPPVAPPQAPRSIVAAAERITTSERIIERVVIGEVSREELNEKLSILNNKLSSEIYKISADGVRNTANITNVYQTVAHTNKIDKLRTVDIFEPTISGGSIRNMDNVGATSVSGSTGDFSTLTGGTASFSSTLSVTATSTLSSGLVVDTNTLFVDAASNRVGIGTTSPYAVLSVVGEAVAARFTATTSVASVFPYASTTALTVSGTASTTALVISNTAGTGTRCLQVSTAGVVSANASGCGGAAGSAAGDDTQIQFNDGDSFGANAAFTFDKTRSLLTVTYASTTAISSTGDADFATSGGNVGIGTTSPQTRLALSGYANSSSPLFLISTSTPTATSTALIVTSSGNVGIGTTAPNNTIQVAGLINFDNTLIGTFLGYEAGKVTAGAGINDTFVGYHAGLNNTGGYMNSGIGMNALRANTTGYYNTAVGVDSLDANTIGYRNAAVGVDSLYVNTEGFNNTALGTYTLYANTTGSDNTAVGISALWSNIIGTSNTAVGSSALYLNTGTNNTAVGTAALYTSTGNYNTAVGDSALRTNTTATSNVALVVE